MATTKTLTPTNQAITLAAFTEKPDNRTNVTNDDKLADAVNALNSNIKTVEYTIPNDVDNHDYDLPTGMNIAIFIGARCFTKYGSWVDGSYASGSYFGDISFITGNGKFRYTANTAGNSTKILFTFLKVS